MRGDKSRWVDAIERALLAGEIDLAVHSAKDVPGELAAGLGARWARPRARRPRTCCAGRTAWSRSPRARASARAACAAPPSCAPRARTCGWSRCGGNVDTRLRRRSTRGEFDAIVLAHAGLVRLGREDARVRRRGARPRALRARARTGRARAGGARGRRARAERGVRGDHRRRHVRLPAAERALARALDASCHTPLGAHATPRGLRLPGPARLGRPARRLGLARATSCSAASTSQRARARAGRADARGRRERAAGARRGDGWPPVSEPVDGESRGRVYLVGAGPGDPGLLTARALELIAAADVILYDRLIPAAALDGARADAELLFVGKEGGGASVPQEQTEALMVDRARAGQHGRAPEGRRPVRVRPRRRGGAARCARRASPSRSSRASPPASPRRPTRASPSPIAGSPARSRSSPATRTPARTTRRIDWPRSPRSRGRSCSTWACAGCPRSPQSLIAAGRPPHEPVAVVERGTLPGQRTVTGTLATIAESGARARTCARPRSPSSAPSPRSPASSPGCGPSARSPGGPSRSPAPAPGQRAGAAAGGARGDTSCRRRSIRTEPLPGPAPDLAAYDLSASPAPTAVAALFERLARRRPATRARSRGHASRRSAPAPRARWPSTGSPPTSCPSASSRRRSSRRSPTWRRRRRALIARAQRGARRAPRRAARARRRGGRARAVRDARRAAARAHPAGALAADYITFTSSSTVRFFLRTVAGDAGDAGGGTAADAGGAPPRVGPWLGRGDPARRHLAWHADRLDRPDHQRRPARARPAGGRGGGRSRHRRPRAGAARGRRGALSRSVDP